MVILFAFTATLIPSILMYVWLRRRFKDKNDYSKTCRKALLMGLLATLPIAGVALALDLIGSLAGLKKLHWLVWALYQTFILYALTEEFFKFFFFRKVLEKTECDCSLYDVTVFMTVVGLGFGISESILYSLTMSPVEAIIRGISLAHGTYGFIMGYFYAKALSTGKKGYFFISFTVPYLLHALYDFSLSPQLIEISDNFAFMAVGLELVELVLVVLMIVFFARRKKNEKYTASLGI